MSVSVDGLLTYDRRLLDAISAGVCRFYDELDVRAPFLAGQLRSWIDALYKSVPLAEAFRLPSAFPMLLVPWTLEQAIRGEPDAAFQTDLVFSSINGYHYIRLIDNIMDGDAPHSMHLLPAVGVLYFQAQAPYQRMFPSADPFWTTFRDLWSTCADATSRDASISELDLDAFGQIAAQKTSAAKIPLLAVCGRYQRMDLFAAWARFHDILGRWHQMTNDLRDWQSDLACNRSTYFLSEAGRRKGSTQSIPEWVANEGYAWAVDLLGDWMSEMLESAEALGSPTLTAYLLERERFQGEWHTHKLAILTHVAQTVSQLKSRLPD